MSAHALDRPVWAALATSQAPMSVGGALARRYQRDISVFAATIDESRASLMALDALLEPRDVVYTMQAAQMRAVGNLQILRSDVGVQMWLRAPLCAEDWEGVDELGVADSAEMTDLAQLTNPGPFLPRTPLMGRFIGLREGGRLVAMAGERMTTPEFVEVSGVCVAPQCRGRGLAGRLSKLVAARIQSEGRLPFLHAWKTNEPAIALYRKLGFEQRCEMHVAVIEKSA